MTLTTRTFICAYPGCRKEFTRSGALLTQIKYKRKSVNAYGPYCSRRCVALDSKNPNRERNDVGASYESNP